MIDKRTFFKQLLSAALVTVVPFTPGPIIPLASKPVDIRMSLAAKMAAELQKEIDRDMINRMIQMASVGHWSPSETN